MIRLLARSQETRGGPNVPGSGANGGLRISDARMSGTSYGAVVLPVVDFLRGTSNVLTEHVTYI